MKILVIGGTGPTGPFIVNGLVSAGHQVTILHTGKHELDTLPPESVVPHIHANPFKEEEFTAALAGKTFDLGISLYGRLRMIAPALVGKVGRLITIGGIPVYSGFMDSGHFFPEGLPMPTREGAPLVDENDAPKLQAIRETETIVFGSHPTATHFRYPGIYGPNQVKPQQWPIVKRALDRRKVLILPDSGLQLLTHIAAENAAHAVLLAVASLDVSAGETYNVSDDRLFTLKQVVEIVERETDHQFDIVSLPYELAKSARPLLGHHASEHRVVDASKIRYQLGYRDIVNPLDAMARTIRWQMDTLARDHREIDARMQDPYDYDAEDRIAALYQDFYKQCASVEFKNEPGWTISYYGPRENPAGRKVGFS